MPIRECTGDCGSSALENSAFAESPAEQPGMSYVDSVPVT